MEGAEEFSGLLHSNRLKNLRVVNRRTHVIVRMWWNYFKANYAIDAQSVTWAWRQIASAMKWKAIPVILSLITCWHANQIES